MAINFCFLDDPTPHSQASRGFHRESYVSPVHSSSGDCCQLYTVGDRHKDCLGATFGRQCRARSCTRCKRSLSRSVHVPSQAFRKHLIPGLSCLPSSSPSAARACMRAHRYTHAHKLVHLQRESHSGKQCTCAVYRLHTGSSAGDEMGGVCECVCVCVGGSAVREQRRVLLPNTRTPSALYDNVRVQERQS